MLRKKYNYRQPTQKYTHIYTSIYKGMAKQATHMPLHVDSQWGICSACEQ